MKNIVLILIVFLAVFFKPQTALACSCANNGDIKTDYQDASVIVTAEAVDVKSNKVISTKMTRSDYEVETQTVVWVIRESWKGSYKVKEKLTTITAVVCCICGMTAEKGDVMILYLHGKAPYSLSICSRTATLKNSSKDLPTLRKLRRR